MKQLVDWSAAVWAGLLAGIVFFLFNILITPLVIGGNAWIMVRLFASVLLGAEILAPPATFHLSALMVALATTLGLSVVYACVIAYIIHRGGLLTGVLFGALLGLAIYLINFYTFTLFFEWFFAMRNPVFLISHLLFGALAGGIYESLEVEEFVPKEPEA